AAQAPFFIAVGGSKLREQAGETVELVGDAVGPERVPVGRDVDRDHRLVEPALGLVGDARHRQIGAELHDRLDVGPVDRLDGIDHVAGGDHGVGGGTLAAHVVVANDVVARGAEYSHHLGLDAGEIGFHDGD